MLEDIDIQGHYTAESHSAEDIDCMLEPDIHQLEPADSGRMHKAGPMVNIADGHSMAGQRLDMVEQTEGIADMVLLVVDHKKSASCCIGQVG